MRKQAFAAVAAILIASGPISAAPLMMAQTGGGQGAQGGQAGQQTGGGPQMRDKTNPSTGANSAQSGRVQSRERMSGDRDARTGGERGDRGARMGMERDRETYRDREGMRRRGPQYGERDHYVRRHRMYGAGPRCRIVIVRKYYRHHMVVRRIRRCW